MAGSSNKRTIVIAVDFGTTYSGIAWGQMSDVCQAHCYRLWGHITDAFLSQILITLSTNGHRILLTHVMG